MTRKGCVAILLLALGVVAHVIALRYDDLTLLSVNASTAIIANVLISIKFLGERFVPRYDIPGLGLICIGCSAIVILSNTEKSWRDREELFEWLLSPVSVMYLCSAIVVIIAANVIGEKPFKQLRQFEKDCDEADAKTNDKIMFPHQGGSERPLSVVIGYLNDTDYSMVS